MARTLFQAAFLLLAGVFALPSAAQDTPTPAASQLVVTTAPMLVDCAPVTRLPCLSAGLTPSDSAGKPAPFALPAAAQLAPAFTMHSASGGVDVKPFYASAGAGPDAAEHTSVALLMIDISGSMNDPSPGSTSRFAAVKSAVAKYVEAMQEGSDRVAIVPFESHNVVSTIRSAVFVTRRADALAQLNALPSPGPKNNTALFQAVFSGVEALRTEVSSLEQSGQTLKELEPHLIVMTDGKNEVLAGDDPQLLNGPLGLQQAAAQVAASHLDVIGIGFGDREAIDAVALQRLSTRFFYAADATELLNALHVMRVARSHEIQVTWTLPEDTRLALAGRDQVWTPSLTTESGTLTGAPIRIIVPAIAPPLYSRAAAPAELQALIATHPPAESGWSALIVHLLLLIAAILLLLVLWYWVPRLIWGERYQHSLASAQRPSSERTGVRAAGVQIRSTGGRPAGFEPNAEAASPIQRSAAQTTQVGPRDEFSRTRLTFEAKGVESKR